MEILAMTANLLFGSSGCKLALLLILKCDTESIVYGPAGMRICQRVESEAARTVKYSQKMNTTLFKLTAMRYSDTRA